MGRPHRVVGMAQGQLGLLPEGQPGVGGHNAGAGALQQPGAKLTLQAADLLAQRRGHQAQLLGGLAHAAELHHLNEIAQLPKLHVMPVS